MAERYNIHEPPKLARSFLLRFLRHDLAEDIISIHVAAYFALSWLENYAYQVETPWWMYALPGLLVVGIALMLVAAKTFKAARQNPVDNLRYE